MDEKMLTLNTIFSPTSAQVVLVITDQTDHALVWKAAFQELGFAAVHETYENALKSCSMINPALIIVDTHLSHTKRLEFCSELRIKVSGPILLLVPDYNSSHIIDIYNTGVDECLLKPVSPAFLAVKGFSWFLRKRWTEQGIGLLPTCTNL